MPGGGGESRQANYYHLRLQSGGGCGRSRRGGGVAGQVDPVPSAPGNVLLRRPRGRGVPGRKGTLPRSNKREVRRLFFGLLVYTSDKDHVMPTSQVYERGASHWIPRGQG